MQISKMTKPELPCATFLYTTVFFTEKVVMVLDAVLIPAGQHPDLYIFALSVECQGRKPDSLVACQPIGYFLSDFPRH